MQVKKAAKKIEKMGRKGDTILAHINEEEAGLLKAMGGSGKRHPKTGLLQFNEDGPGGSDTGSERTGDYNFGGGNGYGDSLADYSGLGVFNGYGGMMGGAGSLNGFADPEGNADANRADGTAGVEGQGGFGGPEYGGPNQNMSLEEQYAEYGRGRQLAEQAAGYGMGATKNAFGDWSAKYGSMNPFAQAFFGPLGAIGAMLGRTSLGTNTGGARGISQSDPHSPNFAGTGGSRGNGFDGGNLPNDGATTPVVPTTGTGGTGGTTTGLPITPPNWGNYGPSPFTYKFGQPRNMDGLLNFGGQTSAQPATQPAAQSSMTNNAIRAMTPQSANWGASMPTGTSMQATNPVPNQYLPGSGLLGAGTISRQGRVADDPYSTTTTSDMMGGRRPSGSFADIFRSMRGA